MAGSCGRTYRIDPQIDPATCNSLVATPSGLLVPRTVVEGIPGDIVPPVGTERSVDVDVTEVPGCPDAWQVGARLTPATGFAGSQQGNADLLAAGDGQVVGIPSADITLPEVGVYHINGNVRYEIGTAAGGSGYIVGHFYDVTTGGLLTSFTMIGAVNASGQEIQAGTTYMQTEYRILSAPRTIRLRLVYFYTGGTITLAKAGGGDSNGGTTLRFVKVRD